MNILILHNNNIPVDLRFSFEFDGIEFNSEVVNYPPYERGDFDSFLCMRLSSLFQKAQYDLIVLPYTLGEDNYSEYSGLRIAAHIRLTSDWNHYSTPLLFIGGDDPVDILRFSDLGALLYTYRVYTSKARTIEELTNGIKHIDCSKIELSYNDWIATQKYKEFLYRINIKAPANYATHHSVANKWAVLRWIEMFSWDGDAPKFEDECFENMLYFKYLIALTGNRECFTKKKKSKDPKKPKIEDIYGLIDYNSSGHLKRRKRIVFIDDEEKMWGKVLEPIFYNSQIDFTPYPFNKDSHIDKKVLIESIKAFLKEDYKEKDGADCYLIDLRLHDDDFDKDIKSDQLSGQQIAKFIKTDLNKGCQVVIFTASNKSWNVETSMNDIRACGYVIKESLEMKYSPEDSYQLYCDFTQKIRKAFKLSYLQLLYKTLDEYNDKLARNGIDITPLYDYADLLNFDNGRNSDIIIKSCITSQTRFLESIINKHNICINPNGDVLIDNKKIGNIFHRLLFHYVKENGHDIVDDVDFIEKERGLIPADWNYAKEKSDVSRIVAALLIFYKISLINVKKTVKMRYERNTSSAHGIKTTTLTIPFLQEHFQKVIKPIIEKESNQITIN